MENLNLRSDVKIPQDIPNPDKLLIYLDDNMFCYVVDNRKLTLKKFSGEDKVYALPRDVGTVVHISYLSVWEVILIATETHLIVFDIDNSQTTSLKCPELKGKIVAVSWNPAQMFLVVVDTRGNLNGYSFKIKDSLYGYQFMLKAEGSLHDRVPDSLYVGWGAHNTQFKGSKKNEEVTEEILQPYSHPVISWRGNGEIFVVNYWVEGRRFLKVFNTVFDALYVSKPFNNLLAPTSFKHHGNSIACVSTDGSKNEIVLFEKNCMVKSRFDIPENKGEIKSVQYHHDLTMLAVHSESLDESCLNIYLSNNHFWYLKYQVYYPILEQEKILAYRWVNNLSTGIHTLNVLTTVGVTVYEFTVEPYGVSHHLVGVINGRQVLFTDFSEGIIPPPMETKTLSFEKPVNKIDYFATLNVYGFVLSDGRSVFYQYDKKEFVEIQDVEVPEKRNKTNNSMVLYETDIAGTHYIIMLSKLLDLVINDNVMCSNVSSFFLHGDYLLFTHVVNGDSHKLSCVRLSNKVISDWNSEKIFSRQVEQGAKIICVTDKDNIVLTLPRGNLETISCRLIAIDGIEHLLSKNLWSKAINQIRTLKLNWNLLIDLDRSRFIACMRKFIEAANSTFLLNVIISEFNTENCLETMYKLWSNKEPGPEQFLVDGSHLERSKIDILGSILKLLVEMNPIVNIVSIVTIQIRHYSVKAALYSVLNVFKIKKLEECQRALAQISSYKQAPDIIAATYTLFNIDFLSFVYANLSYDPKDYTQEIEELNKLNKNDLLFTMSVRGKDFKKATTYIVRSDGTETESISQFLATHETYSIAYNELRPGDKHFKTVTFLYADYLATKSKSNEGALILERAGYYQEALNHYRFARNWRKVIALLNVLNFQSDEKQQSLMTLAQDLINHKQVDDGAMIYEQYCKNYKAAVIAFIANKMFQKALVLAEQYNDKELIEKLIQPALKKYSEALQDRLTELSNKFSQYIERLMKTREKKLEVRCRSVVDNAEGVNDEANAASASSEYGSMISRSSMASLSTGASKMSSMSSRNRRKLEKKKTDLREGGTFEDIALIRQLYVIIIDIFSAGQEVADLCLTLTSEKHFYHAKQLHLCLDNLQQRVLRNIPRIWSDVFLNAETSSNPVINAIIDNRHELDEQFRTPPPPDKLKQDWKLSMFT